MDFITPLPPEEQLHCRRVSAVSAFLAEASGLSSPEVNAVMQSALFHDIGKAFLPQDLLHKSEPLTPSEHSRLLTHTIIGQKLLESTETLLTTAAIVAHQHHEHLDGSGYIGLYDCEIHPHAKLTAAANVFDSLTFRRNTWDLEQVRYELEQRSGPQLVPQYVSMLLNSFPQIESICRHANTHYGRNTHF